VTARVRAGTVEDADVLRTIRLEALADSPGAYGTTYDDVVGQPLEWWRETLAEPGFFLGEIDGRVRGMARGGSHDDFPGETWLFGMYVGPDGRAHVARARCTSRWPLRCRGPSRSTGAGASTTWATCAT
jgi:Acetyltransferase (GNAT) family